MIAENLIYIAMFVFFVMVIGMVLTVLEFRQGSPRRQQEAAECDPVAFKQSSVGRPAR
ncbi:MAG: hypothetical protein ACR2QW_01430 [bacterium]